MAAQILAQGISQEIFNKIYITEEIKTWGEVVGDPTLTAEIHVFTRSDAAGAAEQWSKFAGGKAQEDLKGIGVNGEPSILDTVIKDPLGIGYGNLNSIFDLSNGELVPGIVIPPIDINTNGQADADEIYKVKRKTRSVQLRMANTLRPRRVSKISPPKVNPLASPSPSLNGS